MEEQTIKSQSEVLDKTTAGAQVIDLCVLWRAMSKHRKVYYKVLPITFVISALIMLSIPNYYTCTVLLSPEMNGSKNTSSIASLASSFGLSLGNALGNTTDALTPTLYPKLMNSVDFKTSLFPIKIHMMDSTRVMTYYDYLRTAQVRPWWSSLFKPIKSLISSAPEDEPDSINPFRLTKKQARIVETLNRNIVCDVDKKTTVITISVTDPDPLVCALMADSVKEHLQRFITNYRTNKARVDLEYNQKLRREAMERYDKAFGLYADFMDTNQDLVLESVRMRQTKLENDMQLQYNTYVQVTAQMVAADAQVQQDTPAFTTLQSATVPLKKAGPMRSFMCLLFLFIAFLITSIWIFYKEDELRPLFGLPRKLSM